VEVGSIGEMGRVVPGKLASAAWYKFTNHFRYRSGYALYQIRSYNPFLGSSRRDVPPERLYKVLWVAEKGVADEDSVVERV
jgi:hypothetical protein